MQKFLILIISLFIISFNSILAQNMDTIYVNMNVTATLEFDEEIEIALIAGNPQINVTEDGTPIFKYYDIFKDKKTATIIAKTSQAPTTAITIKLTNGDVFVGFVKFSTGASKPYISLKKKGVRKKNVTDDNITNEDEPEKELDKEQLRLKERIGIVIGKGIKYSTWGCEKNKMQFQVGGMMNDSKNTYLYITVANQSSQQFDVDAVIFKYEEGKRKKSSSSTKEAKVSQRINLVVEPEFKNVPAYTTVQLGYVIPLFSVNDKGTLLIQFIEKNGIRDYTIRIKASETRKLEVFKD